MSQRREKKNGVDHRDKVLYDQRDYFPFILSIHRRSIESNDSFVEKSPWIEIEVEVVLHTFIDGVLLVSGMARNDESSA